MELLDKIESLVLSTVQTIYDAWGWFGVAILLAFENATSITPSEVILGLAGWTLIAEHQLPPSVIFVGGFYSAVGSTFGASITYWIARLGGRPLIDRFAALGAHCPRQHHPPRKPVPALGTRVGAGWESHSWHSHAHQHPRRAGTHAIHHLPDRYLQRRICLVLASDRCRICFRS